VDNTIQVQLKNEYGIECFREESSELELQERGFRKATAEEVTRFNMLFQFAPQIAKDSYYASATKEAFDSAVRGTYRLKLDPRYHLGKSSHTPGAFNGNAFDDQNSLKTQAEWLANTEELDLSKIPQYAEMAFNAASFVTGQYFMAQINRNLAELKSDTEDIKRFLEVRRHGEINDAIEELKDITNRLDFIVLSPREVERTLNKTDRIRSTARINIPQAVDAINIIIERASKKDKEKEIKEKLDNAADALLEYRLLLWVYCQAKLLEIYISGIQDARELDVILAELRGYTDAYFETVIKTSDWMWKYLEENKTVNGKIPLIYGTAGVGLLMSILGGEIGRELSKVAIDKVGDSHRRRIMDYVHHMNDAMDSVHSYEDTVREPVKNLARYIETTRDKIEVVKIGETIYTNMPLLPAAS